MPGQCHGYEREAFQSSFARNMRSYTRITPIPAPISIDREIAELTLKVTFQSLRSDRVVGASTAVEVDTSSFAGFVVSCWIAREKG